MELSTLSVAIALNGVVAVVLTILLAAIRRKRGLIIFALGFVSADAGFILFAFQSSFHPLIGVIGANVLIFFFQFSLSWGLRISFGSSRSWPRRYWAYAAVWLSLMLFSTFVFDSFTLRAAASSVVVILSVTEFIVALRSGRHKLPVLVYRGGFAISALFVVLYAIRLVLLLAEPQVTTRLMQSSTANIYTFMISMVYSILWAGLVLIIDVALMVRELEKMAATDELTGLLNRTKADGDMRAEEERSDRYAEPLSIILFDVDKFKRVNDAWGHAVGDETLKSIAATARSLLRDSDRLYRWGGEEFLILAPHTDSDGAAALSEKVRSALASSQVPIAGTVTASFGVAERVYRESRADWIRRADEAMYRAKQLGRNRVIASQQPATSDALAKVLWRDDWRSGRTSIDEEHRELIELSNKVLARIMGRASYKELESVLDSLFKSIENHFDSEEQVLADSGYPALGEHAARHRELVRESALLRDRSSKGDIDPGAYFNFLVDKVIIGHLLKDDVLFFPYLKGPSPAGSGERGIHAAAESQERFRG